MPFDDPTLRTQETVPMVTVGNTLAALGFIPVPRDVAEQHKQKMLTDYVANNPMPNYAKHMIAIGLVRWETFDFSSAEFSGTIATIQTAFGLPQPILDVAHAVHLGITDAEFSLEFFATDPILSVRYTDAMGRQHYDGLGVWDGDQVFGVAARHKFD